MILFPAIDIKDGLCVRLVRGERQAMHIFYGIADQHVSQVLQDMAVHISEDRHDD